MSAQSCAAAHDRDRGQPGRDGSVDERPTGDDDRGHASFNSPGYDCSGTVSYALHGGNLLATPADSSEFMKWGSHGAGRWIAVFGNSGHAYMDVAGLRLDTSAADDPTNQQGPRWRPLRTSNGGYTVRHPLGL